MKQVVQQLESDFRLAADQLVQYLDSLIQSRCSLRKPSSKDSQQAIEWTVVPVIWELDV